MSVSLTTHSLSVTVGVRARQATVASFPGNQFISDAAARILVERGTRQCDDGTYVWTHDVMIRATSSWYFSEAQVLDMARRVESPCLIITGDRGLPADDVKVRLTPSAASIPCLPTTPARPPTTHTLTCAHETS